jgi:hypothetical protein
MAEKKVDLNYTDVNRLTEMANSKDFNQRMDVAKLMYKSRDLTCKMPIATVEKLATDENMYIRMNVLFNKNAVERLSEETVVKFIHDLKSLGSMALEHDYITKKLSDEELLKIVNRALKDYDSAEERKGSTYLAEVLSDNKDVVKRMPLKIAARLKVIDEESKKISPAEQEEIKQFLNDIRDEVLKEPKDKPKKLN